MLDANLSQFGLQNRVALSWGFLYQCLGEFDKAKRIYLNLSPDFSFYCESHLCLLDLYNQPQKRIQNIGIAGENKKQRMTLDLLNAMNASVNNNYHSKKYHILKREHLLEAMKKSNVVKDVLLSAYCLALLAGSYEDTNKEQSKKLLQGCLKFATSAGNQILIDLASKELGINVGANLDEIEIRDAKKMLENISINP